MAVLAECPRCHRKQAVKNRNCAGCESDLTAGSRRLHNFGLFEKIY